MQTLRLAAVYLRLGVMNELQYRANFFVAGDTTGFGDPATPSAMAAQTVCW